MIARPVVDLPQPDSPTRPRVSPCSTSRLMPETALHLQARVADRELDDEVLDPQQRVVGVAEVGGAGAGHHASAGAEVVGVGVVGVAVVGVEAAPFAARLPRERGLVAGQRLSALGGADRVPAGEQVPGRLGLEQRGLLRRGNWSCAYGQRGLNRQPLGGLIRSGGRPAMTCSRVWLGFSSLGIDLQQRLGVRHPHVREEHVRGRLLDDLARRT